jgi:hypothetical protein
MKQIFHFENVIQLGQVGTANVTEKFPNQYLTCQPPLHLSDHVIRP